MSHFVSFYQSAQSPPPRNNQGVSNHTRDDGHDRHSGAHDERGRRENQEEEESQKTFTDVKPVIHDDDEVEIVDIVSSNEPLIKKPKLESKSDQSTKIFSCHLCSKEYKQIYKLNFHIKISHKDVTNDSLPSLQTFFQN